MKVLLDLPLSTYSGYGNDGIGIARAFMRAGADVYLKPTIVQAPLPKDVAMLLTKELQAPFDLYINHVDPGLLGITDELAAASAINVGWTMWEYSDFGNLRGRTKLKKNLKNFDAIVGYDDVSSACFEPYFDGPILTVQGGYWPEDWPEVERDWFADDFYFCMIGVLSERKDPFLAIKAFSELKTEHEDFDKHARLSMKTSTPGLHSKMQDIYPGLRIFYDAWPVETVRSFYAAQHVLLAPSRGEGKNMPALEFQSTGGTVIATNWGGHTQWLNDQYNYPLAFTLAGVTKGSSTLNARADLDDLKAKMLHVFRNRDEARRKGEIAAQVIPASCSWDKVVERLLLNLKESVPGGDALWQKAIMARQEVDRGNS